MSPAAATRWRSPNSPASRDAFDAWSDAVDGLEALTTDPRHVAVLQGDGMTDERFQAIVGEAAPGIGTVQLNLFRLLRRKGRLGLGPSVASYFRELWDEQRGVERAVVRTAVAIDDERLGHIARELSQWTGKSVEVEAEVDPAMVGGAVIRIGDRLIDGSVRGRLRSLRADLIRSAAGGSAAGGSAAGGGAVDGSAAGGAPAEQA